MKGGAPNVIPMYAEQKNNPGVPLQHKELNAERYAEKNEIDQKRMQQDKQLINLQVYQPQKPKAAEPVSFFPSFTSNPYFPAQLSNMMNPMMNSMLGMYPMTVNLNKISDIDVGGPAGPHNRLNMVYEDILPGKQLATSFKTIGERLIQLQYVRSILFPKGDATETNLDGRMTDSLLSHIKFLDLNPFNTNKLSDNPYSGLPDGFLLYRTCYPIKRTPTFGQISCARDSMALSVRIYQLNVGGYLLNKQNRINFYQYDQWREIAFYEYIRENILKKKICPNFVKLYGYYLCKDSGIDFDKIKNMNNPKLRNKKQNQPMNFADLDIYYKKRQQEFIDAVQKGLTGMNPSQLMQSSSTVNNLSNMQPAAAQVLDLDTYSGEVIVAITESPTYNLYSWTTVKYQQEGNTRRMINSGFHTENVWRSIYFQIMCAILILHKHGIYIDNFSLENNVFIKDLILDGNAINYWKYKINGIDYYIPNYGYLALIDSNYSDIFTVGPTVPNEASGITVPGMPGGPTPGALAPTPAPALPGPTAPILKGGPSIKKSYKLDGKLYDAGNTIKGNEKNKTFEMFKSTINPNNFGVAFGGTKPDTGILDMLQKMDTDTATETDIEKYFVKYMTRFMNNRIGTYLKEQEVIHIKRDLRDFKHGQIIVLREGDEIFKFVLFLEVKAGVATILTKDKTAQNDPTYVSTDNDDLIQKDNIPLNLLYSYSLTEPIAQNYKINESNLTEDNLLETYNIIL